MNEKSSVYLIALITSTITLATLKLKNSLDQRLKGNSDRLLEKLLEPH